MPTSRTSWPYAVLGITITIAAACGSHGGAGPAGSGSVAANAGEAPGSSEAHGPLPAPERAGGTLMRSADGNRLYVADEDHRSVRILPLPFGVVPPEAAAAAASASASAAPPAPRPSASASAPAPHKPPPPPGSFPPPSIPPSATQEEVAVQGAPAQVLPVDGFVLATLRDPGTLLVLKESADHHLEEQARIKVPDDAWGLALTPDEKTAIVTSAWRHQVSAVDWRAGKVLWSIDVGREPRGVVVTPDGKAAYVSHLTSADLTKIDLSAATPTAKRIAFAAAPDRTPLHAPLEASLGYALVIDDGGHRLLAARHALGAVGEDSWYGAPTVDVLQIDNDEPLLAPRVPDRRIASTGAFERARADALADFGGDTTQYQVRQFMGPSLPIARLGQPRALAVAHKTKSLWLASEGNDAIAELAMQSAAPLQHPLRVIHVGGEYQDTHFGDGGVAAHCGAPSGLALSADESLLYVFCRSTYDVVTLRTSTAVHNDETGSTQALARLATDPLDDAAARGRRLFYSGEDNYSSGGVGCAGCHPDGRDDGHVWHEVFVNEEKRLGTFMATQYLADKTKDGNRLGYPRQTPMLVGRVSSHGPYGWHGENETIGDRFAEGFARHRWDHNGNVDPKDWMTGERTNALQAFLLHGLVPPPALGRELDATEKRGKEIFESGAAGCTTCHTPESGFSNRSVVSMEPLAPIDGCEDESNQKFRTPMLLYVGGSPPYYHDGSVATLADLIDKNHDRMGKTNQLSPADRAALVAYLETL